MSYILDALKRSEQERHQGELTPTTIDTILYKPRPAKHQWWPYLLIVVLLINLAVYVYFQFTRDVVVSAGSVQSERSEQQAVTDQHQQMTTGTQAQNAVALSQSATNQSQIVGSVSSIFNSEMTSGTTVKPLPDHVLQAPSLNKFYELNPIRTQSAGTSIMPKHHQEKNRQPRATQSEVELNDEGFEVIRPKQMPTSNAVVPENTDNTLTETKQQNFQSIPDNYELIEPARDSSVTQVSEVNVEERTEQGSEKQRLDEVPHLSDMPGVFQADVPDIRFNSHIYSAKPAERRVMINDLYLKEGESFSGMRIETIGEFYIELEKQGQHFKLPVLRDWFSPR